MSKSFYVTLPSHSSKSEFPSNTANHFKIRLPNPIRLEGTGWKVGLSSISLPDTKNVLPHWLTETQALFFNTWFQQDPSGARRFLSAPFKVTDVHDILDLNSMTGVSFMKTVIEWFNKQRYEKNLVPGNSTGYTNSSGKRRNFHITYRFEGEDLVIDGSNIEYQDFGRPGLWKSPLFVV